MLVATRKKAYQIRPRQNSIVIAKNAVKSLQIMSIKGPTTKTKSNSIRYYGSTSMVSFIITREV